MLVNEQTRGAESSTGARGEVSLEQIKQNERRAMPIALLRPQSTVAARPAESLLPA